MRLQRTVGIVVAALALVAVVAPSAWPGIQRATSHERRFHAHINAYYKHEGCGGEWGRAAVSCIGQTEDNGLIGGFDQRVSISWCAPGGAWHGSSQPCGTTPDGTQHTLPHGYDRWMMLDRNRQNYLLGAVKWPNGPFAVVTGVIDKHHVTATSTDQSKVEHQGGPLYLYVGYHGKVDSGNHLVPSEGYVFGFRGWLNY
jgi:hypothetical protein